MLVDWTPLIEIVGRSESFVLTSHMRPDCDALGSELGMAGVLQALGKRVLILNGDVIPRHLRFIDPAGRIKQLGADVAADQLGDYQVLVVLDTSAWKQLGPMADVLRGWPRMRVVIDHHVSEDDLGAVTLKNAKSEATGRLVLEAAAALGVRLTREIAEPLFTAMATDTGWFRFASVTGDTYRAVGQLIDAGVRPEHVYGQLYEQDSLARVCLRGRILARAETENDDRLVHAQVARADFQQLGAETADTEDVINMLLRIAGSEVAVLVVELEDGVKASFRSRGTVDVRQIAEQFGGGGHTAAAGASLPGPLAAARERILDAVRKAMQ